MSKIHQIDSEKIEDLMLFLSGTEKDQYNKGPVRAPFAPRK